MATARKKTTTRKKTARKPVRRNATKRTTRKATTRKPMRRNATKKKTTTSLTWAKSCTKHPVTGKPCAGRVMSKRDQKLFTKVGKRRAGVTPTMVKEAYGLKATSAKKKTTARKSTAKKTTARKPAARKTTAKRKGSSVTVSKVPARAQRFVIVDGRMAYQSSSKLLTSARKKVGELEKKFPRKTFRIVDTKG